ncbi:ABC-2 type transport system permease protein [Crossiella equi]|uniref:ABC-2 type transport system permease protein n=1 Tax=Crossiella equi TaxID=130796 RepID=A0ABS5AAB4_9PSEU|nr:ABC transporter permease [Crossiella equi]MBP2473520.1 ABC-2 type transport system permease protein [Crossiella equi]
MRATLVILTKDLSQRLRDVALIIFAVILPLGMAFLFNLVLGNATQPITARYAVLDQDRGALSAELIDHVLKPMDKDGRISLRTASSQEEGVRQLEAKELDALYVLPAGFSADAEAGRPAVLRLIGNVDSAIQVQVAREIAESYAAGRRSVQLALAVVRAGGTVEPEREAELTVRVQTASPPVSVTEDASAARRELDSKTFYAAGMAVFFLFFAALFTVTGILDERRAGTLPRLLAAPIRPRSILVGKMLSGVLVGIINMIVLVLASTWLLDANWGQDVAGLALLILAGVLAATGVMSVVAVFARTGEQASNWQSAAAMLLGVLGGALFPVADLGGLSVISYFTPHRWFLRGLADLSGGGGLAVVWTPVLVLLGFAVAGGAIALLRLGKVVRS